MKPLRCFAVAVALLPAGCGGSPSEPTPMLTVTAGAWSYAISANVPLPNPPGPPSCVSPSVTGTTAINSSGGFAMPFSGLACNNCSMSGTVTGTVVPTGVSGSVTATIAGAGCSGQQPTPSPASMTGTCTPTRCTVTSVATASFAVTYTLTPP